MQSFLYSPKQYFGQMKRNPFKSEISITFLNITVGESTVTNVTLAKPNAKK
jgi:hypothetical protein